MADGDDFGAEYSHPDDVWMLSLESSSRGSAAVGLSASWQRKKGPTFVGPFCAQGDAWD